MRIPELLAPAGTPAKLRTALDFGADAFYLGLKDYSLRSFAGNFTLDQVEWAVRYAHERGRKVYVTLNIQAVDADFDGLQSAARALAGIGPDAVVVTDPGLLAWIRREHPDLRLHLSTQASVTNARGARFWFDQGVRRIVMARELSIDQLAVAVERSGGEIEAFVHGAVCIAYSGRCLLSLYWAGEDRDPRRGSCAQGCRWAFRAIEDRRRPGLDNPVAQDERGTYFFDARDLCGLPLLDRMVNAGLHALKIEGRMRSNLYVAVATDVYRHALDRLAADPGSFPDAVDGYMAELSAGTNRGFSTHFLDGKQDAAETYNPGGSYSGTDRNEYVGRVTSRGGAELTLELANPLRADEEVELIGPGLRRQVIRFDWLRDGDGGILEQAPAGRTVTVGGAFEFSPLLVRRRLTPAAG